jgi:uncharacterized membrane protein YesL
MFGLFIIPFLLVALMTSYFTSVACRLALSRHRSVHWSFALIGAGVAAVLTVGFIWCGLSLQPGQLPYLGEWLRWLSIVCIGGGLFALFPAEAVVWYFHRRRRQYDDDLVA